MVLPFVVPSIRAARVSGVKLTQDTRRFYRQVLDHLAGAKEARAMNVQAGHNRAFDILAEHVSLTRRHFDNAKATASFLFSSGITFVVSAVIYAAITVVQIPIADLVILVVLFSRLTPRILRVQSGYQDFVNALSAYETIRNLESCSAAATEELHADPDSGEIELHVGNDIELSGLGFQYERDTDWAVRNVNLRIRAQQITAIVGASGAGKTTLANLLLGLLRPDEGRILADGYNVHQKLFEWRNSIGYVPQETFLLNDTVGANLLWAKPGATDEQIMGALKLAAADDVIRSLPDGLDTEVGERGTRLSGGQRQRISLARALVRNPSVLILDEATSALDADNADRIHHALRDLARTLTIIVITHRQSTVMEADTVVVLDSGHVVAHDSFVQVAAQGHLASITLDLPNANAA